MNRVQRGTYAIDTTLTAHGYAVRGSGSEATKGGQGYSCTESSTLASQLKLN